MSKYEDALHYIKHHYDADMYQDQFNLLDEAIRKAEIMDRLIEEMEINIKRNNYQYYTEIGDRTVSVAPE